MNLKDVKNLARERMKGYCRVCKECNGVACAGEVPGMGGCGSGESFKRNYESLRNIKLVLKTIHDAKDPDTSVEIFKTKIDLPLITAPVTGSSINMGGYLTEQEYSDAAVMGSIKAGTIAMTGDSANPDFYIAGLNSIKKANGKGIAIIKPRENSKIIENIKKAEESGALAVGIDIDGAGLITMALNGQPVGPKTLEELKELTSSTNLPFIIKGIMCVEDAVLAVEAGASAIVVSNHGGRVLNNCLAPSDVLEDIAKEVKGKVTILADGNVREGADILKYIALGADAVLCARPIIWGAYGGYDDGVKLIIDNFKNELKQAMILTGCKDIKSIDKNKIVNLNKGIFNI
ncbi:FMN-dependent dehydrogenase, includes L-lactate dehydrogenase and type II isopentenyl diphosphate isomerase [Alkalithermobacter thermoalcaliphilus JW-YL-7 = DSM 7308]|uniref:L-lactate oxidase n=1 Tax=Alkalithermobacter thermoalcaliphilus JW-YL-7 = DSM 7308 TaxID=1121328 RepID=A0A150FP39_CLOPD|nr:(S)-2-hydroxy-acid oxidase [[Clostridium] paradoxum JW-YL-7 = DSM 7308]SHK55129.1 FMN-dependent dehydrogenase, includes L-lactate dehydrogenase and type II isopentenyl diphosphate isomerase [[Clostridium] paradoxum JW-YL-7 = DSM 7308]